MPLGAELNLATSATTAAQRTSLRDCSGVLIVLIGATSGNATITEANASSGGTSQNLAQITTYFTQVNGVWTRVTQAAAATITAATGGLAAVFIPATMLSDGFEYVAASHASGSFLIIQVGLKVARKPENLRDVRA